MTRSALLGEPETATAPLQCVDCGAALTLLPRQGATCAICGRDYPVREGLLIAQGELTGKNRIAAAFYNSDRWLQFRPWEQLFLKTLGGLPGARRQILRHLRDLPPHPQPLSPRRGERGVKRPPYRGTRGVHVSPSPPSGGRGVGDEGGGRLLEVGIGDGENVALLPRTIRIAGVDIAERPLAACRDRHSERGLFLALAEGERLPFADGSFDAVLSVGGFNFYSDPECALKEMSRVTRPDGRIVVADELPDLFEWGWGHLIGLPRLDDWLMRRFWLGPEFTDMVLGTRLDVQAIARATLRDPVIHRIWRGLGYCIVGSPLHE